MEEAAKQININTSKYEDFRAFLVSEFEKRKEKNSNYSLRAYASFLDTHAACLSVILKGKRPLTQKLVTKFGKKLKLSKAEIGSLCSISDDKSGNLPYELMSFEVFKMLSEWHYDAICELVRLQDFKNCPKWIAKILGISRNEVNIAIERLLKYEFLTKDKEGNLSASKKEVDLQVDDFTSAALKKLQIKALEMSTSTVDEININHRHHATMTMAIDISQMPAAKQKLREFKQQFCNEMQSNSEKNMNAVYQLQLGFFPLTKNIKDI